MPNAEMSFRDVVAVPKSYRIGKRPLNPYLSALVLWSHSP
jgi:hypothetical protein